MRKFDDYIFNYLLHYSGCLRYWRFRDLPRDGTLEAKIRNVTLRELAGRQKGKKWQEKWERPPTIWKYLKLPEKKLRFRMSTISQETPSENALALEDTSVELECWSVNSSEHIGMGVDEAFFFFVNNGEMTACGVDYIQIEQKKVILPFSITKNNELIPVWGSNMQRIFFNNQYLERAKAVIFTDDVALADENQRMMLNTSVCDIVWLSWYGDPSLYPWSDVKGKDVYYFVALHSGFEYEHILKEARNVKNQLLEKNGQEMILLFLNPSEIMRRYYSGLDDSLPLLTTFKEFDEYKTYCCKLLNQPFDIFWHKVTPRRSTTSKFFISPFIRCNGRTLIQGGKDEGRLWLLTLFFAFCTKTELLPRVTVPEAGVIIYWHPESIDMTEWYWMLQNRNKYFIPPNRVTVDTTINNSLPCVLDRALNITEICSQSISDINNLISLFLASADKVSTSRQKLFILDSFLALFSSYPDVFQELLQRLHESGWGVVILESSRVGRWKKVLGCDCEINIKSSPSIEGREFAYTSVSAGGKVQKKIYRINFEDLSNPLLSESPCNRKSQGLMRDRADLLKEMKALIRVGAKGKEIAEKLEISESMVKKLKREWHLSKERKPRTDCSTGPAKW